jgi:spore coat protein U-like protein
MFSKRICRFGAAAAISALAFAPLAVNAAATSSVTVSATVSKNCVFGSSTPTTVTFAGGYDPVGANASTAATATYSPQYVCTSGDNAYTWSFTSANHAGTQAVLKSGGTSLNYNITDASNNAYKGDGSNSFNVGATATGTTQTYSSFTFTIPAAQVVPVGTYTDTVTVTLSP